MAPRINQAGLDLIKTSEGFRSQIYDDLTGKVIAPGDKIQGKPTVGYGHNCNAKGYEGIELLEVISRERGEQLLLKDLVGFEDYVYGQVPFVNDNQFAAVSVLFLN
ncbi:unnamed protein product, partial [Medioppia subpectinata]